MNLDQSMNETGSNVKNDHSRNKASPKEADFEVAVAATGHGKFHYLLYLAVIPATWASGFDTSTTSMIIPSAECDFDLTLFQKGVLNAVVYAGMVSSALMWGFIADAFGRKPVVIYGYLTDGILNVLSGLSQNFYALLFFKFACGFIVNGPYASVMTYSAEFRRTKDRPKVTMMIGFFLTAGSIVGAALALLIIPQNISFSYYSFNMHSWQIYLSVCGLPIVLGAIFLSFFPESPKFLMSQGHNENALRIFKKMFAMNSGKSEEAYPIKLLENELASQSGKTLNSKSFIVCARNGLLQMKPLFIGSYFPKLLLVVIIQFCGMLSTNTIRLWQPQLFAIITKESTAEYGSLSLISFCDVIDKSTFTRHAINMTGSISNNTESSPCNMHTVSNYVYTNTIIISASSLFFTFFSGLLVGSVNNKYLLLICYSVSTCSVLILNWSNSMLLTLICISVFVGCLSASVNLVISVVVNLFPTTMRTMAVSLTMMFGRIGSLIGNLLFPILLQYGCTIALMTLTILVLVACGLTILIPKAEEAIK